MPRRLVCALLGLAVGPLLLGSRAGAQTYGAWGTDITLGWHTLSGTQELAKQGAYADILFTGGRRVGPKRHLVGGAGIGGAGNFLFGDVCTITPSGGCERSQWFRVTSLLVGMAHDLDHKSARVLVGAAQYADSATAWGVQVRADLALELHRHAGLVPTVRATYLPSYLGERLVAWSLGVGVSFR